MSRFLKLFAGVPVEIRQVGIDAKSAGLSAAGKQAAAAGRPLVRVALFSQQSRCQLHGVASAFSLPVPFMILE